MTEPIWISKELACAIHKRQLAEHGGMAGVRDEGLLESALARPRHVLAFSGAAPDIANLAAAYAFGIAKNHPFLDGNKRTAAVVCEAFIEINGHQLTADDQSWCVIVLQLASGELTEQELAEWLRAHLVGN